MSNRKAATAARKLRKEQKKTFRGQTIFKPVKLDNIKNLDVKDMISGRVGATVSRNGKCPCGSRKRFKRCCMKKPA